MSWFGSLSLRARTLTIGGAATAALVAVGFLVPIPYVALGPGVTYNTLGDVDGQPVISFTGDDIPAAASEPVSGHLNMTTISVYSGPDDGQGLALFPALGMWLQGDYAVVPREEVYPPDKTVEQVNEQNAQLFSESQSAAEIAALRYLDYPEVPYVGTIPEDSPSFDILDPQDRILAVDGEDVPDVEALYSRMDGTEPGQSVDITVERDGEELTKTVVLGTAEDGSGMLGIIPVERPVAPFGITISLADIGGPSAGLMFTLGIVDRLSEGDLTGGRFVAGTGTINPQADGTATVGPIGGVNMKTIAARAAGAEYFLVPADNCAEAMAHVPDGLTLVRVATLDDATTALATIVDGGTPGGC